MSIFNDYIERVGMSKRTHTDAKIVSSIEYFERNFHTSPSYYQVDIDGELVDTIINKTSHHNIKKIHFRRNYEPKIGSIITFQNKKYLLLEIDRDEIYTFGKMEECNNVFPVHTGEIENVQVGVNGRGVPVFKEVYKYDEIPCIVRDRYYSVNENSPLPLPDGKLQIELRYIEAPNIEINETFEMYGREYKISDISYVNVKNGVGTITIHAEKRDDANE